VHTQFLRRLAEHDETCLDLSEDAEVDLSGHQLIQAVRVYAKAQGKSTIDSRIVVIELSVQGEPTLVGLRTDKVHEVTTLNRADSEPPPSIGMRWRPEFIRCLVKRNGEFIAVPDLQQIFDRQQDTRAPAALAQARH
jgi:chemotaxis signal transduction protein